MFQLSRKRASNPHAVCFALALALFPLSSARAADWYVSSGEGAGAAARGADTNAGSSLAAPFAHIQRAADVAKPGDMIYVRGGIYRETVTPARSGTAAAPVVYRPYRAESVTISGADVVARWSRGPNGTYRAAMPAGFFHSAINQSDQVFVDGRMAPLARWPNTSPDVSMPAKSTITRFISKTRDTVANWTTAVFEDSHLPPAPAGSYVGAEIVIQPNKEGWSWTLSGTVVAHEGTRLTIRSRNDSGQDGNQAVYTVGSRYYLHNLRRLLDADGEWFHDLSVGQLYLRAPDGGDASLHMVEAKRRDYAFILDSRSYIVVQGFHLFACSITTDTSAGSGVEWDDRGNDLYPWRGSGSVAAAHHIVLDGLDAKYLNHFTDMSGHFFLQWGQNTGLVLSGSDCIVRNCTIRYGAGHGIVTLGQRNKVVNNKIEDVSYQQVDCAGISTGGAADSSDHEIAFNTVRRCGRSGILPRGFRNSQPGHLVARIHHNDISECMLQDLDGGCIYASGDGTFVRIDHNWCHDVSGFASSGIYPDILTNWIIDHNVVWNVEWGIHLQNNGVPAANAICYNNTILVRNSSSSPYGPFGFANNSGHNQGSLIMNNIVACLNVAESKGYQPVSGGFEQAEMGPNLFWDGVPGSATDPRFVDFANRAFGLKSNSPARGTGKLVPAVTRGGLAVPAFNEVAGNGRPDMGAYIFGQPYWKPGFTPPVHN